MSRIAYVQLTSDQVGSFTETEAPEGPVYTRDFLKGTLQLLGCKPRFAEKLGEHAFKKIETLLFGDGKRKTRLLWRMHPRGNGTFWVSIPRRDFDKFMLQCLASVYVRSTTIADDWRIATGCVTILLCGTSGTGKSTLASLLAALSVGQGYVMMASRLRISTVISTDSVRGMMRSLTSSERDHPIVFASSYNAGQALQQQRRAMGIESDIPPAKLTVKGFKAQSESVLEQLERIISESENRGESLICEGVHLSLNFVIRLMRSHPSIVPFLIYIGDEQQHVERFSIRTKYMTTDGVKNRYVHHIHNIRCIQEFLIRKADVHLIPKVNNTNVDRSVAAIHQTTFGCLRRVIKGEKLYDIATNTAKVVHAEYKQVKSTAEWKAKSALEAIRSKGQDVGVACVPSGSSMMSSDDHEDLSDDVTTSQHSLERVVSSDTNDEIAGSDSSDSNVAEPAQTEYGSLMETTDWDEHDE